MYGELAGNPGALSGPFAIIQSYAWLIMAAGYVLCAWLQSRIARKTGPEENAWWAYVPIMNTFLLIKMADKPMWWFLLLLVPLVNIVTFVMLWISVAQRAGQAGFWGFLAMVPGANLAALIVMAFGNRRYDHDYDLPTLDEDRRAG